MGDDVNFLMKELARFLDSQPTPSEERLLREAPLGNIIDFSDENGEKNDPKTARDWGDARTIRARCIRWLLTDKQAKGQISLPGLRIRGAKILGPLALEYATLPFLIEFEACAFDKPIFLTQAHLKALSLRNSDVHGVLAPGITVDGSVGLDKHFRSRGSVVLARAMIGGQLLCSGGEFHNPGHDALKANSVQVTGGVFLDDEFQAKGKVSLMGATTGQLICSGGKFHNPDDIALQAQNVQVADIVFLDKEFKAVGMVSLARATIGGQLICSGGEFHNPDGIALQAQSMHVTGNVYLDRQFKAVGTVSLAGAAIGGQLVCTGGEFHSPGDIALFAAGMRVADIVFLDKTFKAVGMVSLARATIGGQLICTGGEFHNPDGIALQAQSVQVTDAVFLDEEFKAMGSVSLIGATIGGQLVCSRGEFHNPDGIALHAQSVQVTRDVFLNKDFKAVGMVSFAGATIHGELTWEHVMMPGCTKMNLRDARVKSLADEADSWPEDGNLLLLGFRYEEIAAGSPWKPKARIRWLRLQVKDAFHAQPYEQLASVLRESGHERAAKKIQITKHDDRWRSGDKFRLVKSFRWFPRVLTGYGYKPWRSMGLAVVLICIGWWLFYAGGREGIIMSTDNERFASTSEQQGELVHPNFYPLVYSLDAFLPVISFEHAEHWAPNENLTGHLIWFIRLNGHALRICRWILTVAGWVLTTLFIAALSGAISRRLS